jgi:hypothetical protein
MDAAVGSATISNDFDCGFPALVTPWRFGDNPQSDVEIGAAMNNKLIAGLLISAATLGTFAV